MRKLAAFFVVLLTYLVLELSLGAVVSFFDITKIIKPIACIAPIVAVLLALLVDRNMSVISITLALLLGVAIFPFSIFVLMTAPLFNHSLIDSTNYVVSSFSLVDFVLLLVPVIIGSLVPFVVRNKIWSKIARNP